MSRYYAIHWTYGRASNVDGTRCGQYYSFPTKFDRDEWVSNGNPCFTQAGARDAISSRDAELRRFLRQQQGACDIEDCCVLDIEIEMALEATAKRGA